MTDIAPEARTGFPVRQRSLHGVPKPLTSIERTCRKCGASFIGSAPGKTGERGIWSDWTWYCSAECAPADLLRESPATTEGTGR